MPNVTTLTAENLSDLFDAFNRHDLDTVMTYFADDCVFNAVAGPEVYGARFEGAQAMRDAFAGVMKAMPDAQWGNHSHFVKEDRGVSEWTFSGTNSDGSRIEAEGVDLFRLCNNKIVLKQAFRKTRPLLRA